MRDMFKKINAREKLIGWYHSGPKLRASDLEINELFKKYTPNPLLVIVDVQPKEVGVPTDAYFAVDEIKDVSCNVRIIFAGQRANSLFLFFFFFLLGWHNNIENIRPHPIRHRSGRSRGNRCGTSSPRHQRRGRWNPFHPDNFATPVAAGIAPTTTRYWPISPESA